MLLCTQPNLEPVTHTSMLGQGRLSNFQVQLAAQAPTTGTWVGTYSRRAYYTSTKYRQRDSLTGR